MPHFPTSLMAEVFLFNAPVALPTVSNATEDSKGLENCGLIVRETDGAIATCQAVQVGGEY